MISAVNNNKNQFFERVSAVNFQAQRGYPPEFYQEMMKKSTVQDDFQKKTDDPRRVEKTFGSLLTYGKSNVKGANPFAQEPKDEYNLNHPDIKDDTRAQKFDFMA